MDIAEAIKALYSRIERVEPEYVGKIVGYICLKDNERMDVFKMALSASDDSLLNLIHMVKTELGLTPRRAFSSITVSTPESVRFPVPGWHPQLVAERLPPEEYSSHKQPAWEDTLETSSSLGLPSDYYNPETPKAVRPCHYFNKGFCKHGTKCRYFHVLSEKYPNCFGVYSNDNDDLLFSLGSLERLEVEIIELLKPHRGPVSIASLPSLYFDKYGKTLQADGYLTESQRHGRAGCSLTKLLAKLKRSIRLIERPHGQHCVILAEDAPKDIEYRSEKSGPGPIISGSRQIYLTFPAESTFTEEDVADYFGLYGRVEDVRIPCQEKRMFGFVTFESADTVRIILAKGNPHYVSGARVLVKPYREKLKNADRSMFEKFEYPLNYHSQMNPNWEFQPESQSSMLFRKRLMEEQQQALNFENLRISNLRHSRRPSLSPSIFGYSLDDQKAPDETAFPSSQNVNYVLDVLTSKGSTSDDNLTKTSSNINALEKQISQIARFRLPWKEGSQQ